MCSCEALVEDYRIGTFVASQELSAAGAAVGEPTFSLFAQQDSAGTPLPHISAVRAATHSTVYSLAVREQKSESKISGSLFLLLLSLFA